MAEESCDKAEREEDKDSAEGKREDEPEYGGEGEFCRAARKVPDEPETQDAVARADAGDKAEDEDAKERGVEGGHFWRVVGGEGYRFGCVAGPVPGSFMQFL